MELFIFVRYYAREGQEAAVMKVLREAVGLARQQQGCLWIEGFRATDDPRRFHVHSRWADEAAFQAHAELPHVVRFLEQVELLIDRPIEVTRGRPGEEV